MVNKGKTNKKLKPRATVQEENSNLIELKITHVLPRYEKSKNVEIHDSPLLTVWKDDDSVNFWIGGTIAVLNTEDWDEIKRELRVMLLSDVNIEND